jgi:hypothetical protein
MIWHQKSWTLELFPNKCTLDSDVVLQYSHNLDFTILYLQYLSLLSKICIRYLYWKLRSLVSILMSLIWRNIFFPFDVGWELFFPICLRVQLNFTVHSFGKIRKIVLPLYARAKQTLRCFMIHNFYYRKTLEPIWSDIKGETKFRYRRNVECFPTRVTMKRLYWSTMNKWKIRLFPAETAGSRLFYNQKRSFI